jgi:hypothetical protein
VDGREVDDELSLAARHCKTVGTEHHLLDGGSIGEAHEDDAGAVGHIERLRRGLRARFDKFGGLAAERFQTVTAWPAFNRRRAIGNPIIPSPR